MTRIVVLALVLSAGCKIANEQSCQRPENMDKPECAGVTGPECADNTDCAGTPTPVCKTDEETCVQCLVNDDCTASATAPICGDTNSCEGCKLDDQCPAGVCLEGGACASPDAIIFASPDGADTPGCGLTAADPCNLQQAIDETTPTRNIVKLTAETFEATGADGFVVDGANVPHPITVIARGATISRGTNGPGLTIKNDGKAELFGGTVTGLAGATGHGVQCLNATLAVSATTIDGNAALGVRADTCTLSVTNATLRSNLGGGISVNNGTFVIVGNILHFNGLPTGTVGGIKITTMANAGNRLDFNTLNQNFALEIGPGIDCFAGTFVARNNILWNNGNGTNLKQVAGGCRVSFSDVGPMDLATANDGGDNVNMDPMFLDESSDLHLMPASPVTGLASALALGGVAAVDLDGDERTSPPDIGADELP